MTKSITFSKFNRFILLVTALLLVITMVVNQPKIVQAYTGYPTFSIVSVEKDVSVTIQTKNLPPNQTFTVRMGKFGTLGIGGTVVGTTDSGEGGVLTLKYNIPDVLKGSTLIAIRMDSTAGYYAYDWFTNSAATPAATATPSGTKTPAPTATAGYKGIPTFSIVSVVQGDKVTIKTSNFPAKQTFTVRMGAYGTLGVGGTVVGTTDSGGGGAFEATYDIPDALAASSKIAIRLESPAGYFAYNWFVNAPLAATATPVPGTTPTPKPTSIPGYTGIPTFSISAVVKDSSVTISAKNFPPNMTFTVKMGAYGTMAVGGTTVGTKETGAGGSFSETYTIPDNLKGSSKIAIRLESTAGYFAYNWFWNNNAP